VFNLEREGAGPRNNHPKAWGGRGKHCDPDRKKGGAYCQKAEARNTGVFKKAKRGGGTKEIGTKKLKKLGAGIE